MKILLSISMLISLSLFSQNKDIPSQQELAKDNIWRFFPDIPKHFLRNLAYSTRARDYDFLLNEYFENNGRNPFKVFQGDNIHMTPNEESHPSFANDDFYFDDVSKTEFGVCSGLTYLMRKFHQLSFYDPENILDLSIPLEGKNPKAWFSFYKEKIDRVYKLKPAIFPGFKNFNELSAHPKLGRYLKELTLAQWIEKNMTIAGLIQLDRTFQKKMPFNEVEDLYHDLAFRLSLGYKPIIHASAFNKKKIFPEDKWSIIYDKNKREEFKKNFKDVKENLWIHVLNVYKVEKIDDIGSFAIYTWDINSVSMDEVPKKIIIQANGKIKGDFSNVGAVYLYPHDDYEVSQIVINKLEWCTKSDTHKKLCLSRKIED